MGRAARFVVLGALALALTVVVGGAIVRAAIAAGVREAAAARGLAAHWTRLDVRFPLELRVRGLAVVRRDRPDTVATCEALAVTLDPWSLLTLAPRPARIAAAHARLRLTPAPADADRLALEPAPDPSEARGARLRARAAGLVRALLLPARRLPALALRDVALDAGEAGSIADVETRGLALEWLALEPRRGAVRLAGAGTLRLQRDVPFALDLAWGRDDRLAGGARFEIPDPARGAPAPLALAFDGVARQDRAAGTFTLEDGARLAIGPLATRVRATVAREGPRIALALEADSVTAERLRGALPRPVLGPLEHVAVRGAFDYRLALELDVARPDSVAFEADVVPRGLALDPARTRLPLFGLEAPFTATVRLPRGRVVLRDLSPANPHFVPLEAIDSVLVHAVVTNEDGAFYRHRGFNTGAVREAIAENLRAGAFRRGAGTITMQFARNLFLGHDRTLSRKFQEVVLAWMLEHLTPLPKRRMLEIYLNVIEWGPDVHGADEAAAFYFGGAARELTVDEALFLATLVPSPSRWTGRFDRGGALRPHVRAQMHFIGRAMIAKGWLDPARLPPADSLRIELRGPAAARFASPSPDPATAAPSPAAAEGDPSEPATPDAPPPPPASQP